MAKMKQGVLERIRWTNAEQIKLFSKKAGFRLYNNFNIKFSTQNCDIEVKCSTLQVYESIFSLESLFANTFLVT